MEIKKEWLEYAKVNEKKYSSMYDHSLQNNDEFWAEQAQRVDWINKFTKIKNVKWSSSASQVRPWPSPSSGAPSSATRRWTAACAGSSTGSSRACRRRRERGCRRRQHGRWRCAEPVCGRHVGTTRRRSVINQSLNDAKFRVRGRIRR